MTAIPSAPRMAGRVRRHPAAGSPDAAIAELAGRQQRVVARWQLMALGLRPDLIDRRVRSQRVFVVHRGVYAVGIPDLEWLGRVWAAVLAGGPDAAASHRTAGELAGTRDGGRRVFDIVVPRTRHGVPGVVMHRARDLRPGDVTRRHGIPVTTVARTLLDRAATVTTAELRSEIAQARQRGILDVPALEAQLSRHRGYPGAARLRRLVLLLGDRTESELEDLMLALLRRANLPPAEVNHPFAASGRHVRTDFRWPGPRAVVEVDGEAFHRDRAADYARDLDLRLAGWTVLRFTWHQVRFEEEKVVAAIRLALAAGA